MMRKKVGEGVKLGGGEEKVQVRELLRLPEVHLRLDCDTRFQRF